MIHIELEEFHTSLTSSEIFALFQDQTHVFFLDSSLQNEDTGKYSFIGFDPFLTISSKQQNVHISSHGITKEKKANPFYELQKQLNQYTYSNKSAIPFLGGAVGYFSYDLCYLLEDLPTQAVDDLKLPDMYFGFYDVVIIFDHYKNKTYLSTLQMKENSEKLSRKKEFIKQKITTTSGILPPKNVITRPDSITSNFSQDSYKVMVETAKKYIYEGDIFQVNLSQRFSQKNFVPPAEIYLKLRTENPAPFSGYLDCGTHTLLSSSPERYLKIRNRDIETRPIKGTIKRGRTLTEERRNKKVLSRSKKDTAENLMIVDLMRNDLGKVCEFGSIRVLELFKIETYASVHHLVSKIIGKLRPNISIIDCIVSSFPGGSITGAPKVRAMEIIDSLEPTRRSIYTGSFGYIGFDSSSDLNILIRSLVITNDTVYYQVGGGIVWDSIGEKEYQETLEKGKAIRGVLKNGL